ncbi:ATP-dependent DNA helicase [Haliangium ochraceum]|uniref:DNA 5'-3' helicase n=1 Tax=Haliangium ochraceum (strain DSM 14365 / JCM 11303 / SMP-2) TaxID=502025 RepID=D0LP70_HALO1|nr:helicase C-terminal domain-containing protein [Haliangium ochraceum]ACY13435.1 helicase c2 [Haliangium ochraceum DSM 14365]
MSDYIDTVFGPDGLLADRFPAYAPRPGQISLARAVDAAIADGEHLLAEAPTGTGKSLAYAVPASYHAAHNGLRVVLATSSINLQEQLAAKDLPFLEGILPWPVRFALLKGKRNYLCLSRLQEAKKDGFVFDISSDIEMKRSIHDWASETKTGDKSELSFEPPDRIWENYSTSAEECKGRDCRYYSECFATKARAEAEKADIIVSNYHLLCVHLQLREATGQDLVLPKFDVAVCDEGHKLADIARDFFGFRVTPGSLRWLAKRIQDKDHASLALALDVESRDFFEALHGYQRSDAYKCRLRQIEPVPYLNLHGLLREIADFFGQTRNSAPDPGMDGFDAETQAARIDDLAEAQRTAARAALLADNLSAAMELANKDFVYYLEELPKGGVALCGKPIEVNEQLRTTFFDQTQSTIVTSATLTAGDSFDYVRKDLGVPSPRELVVDSPFDFRKQVLFIVPDCVIDPRGPGFPTCVAWTVEQAVRLAGGRTLGLFTSYRNLDTAYARIADCGYRVLRQGDKPRTQLVDEFRRDVKSVLLGTESFWAGVDVQGEALSCVVIDRLPFPPPNDPVIDALKERGGNSFLSASLPRAIIAFKQGFGRLIRASDDRGVVVVLDERLYTTFYGRAFLRSLPAMRKSRTLEDVQTFLAETPA